MSHVAQVISFPHLPRKPRHHRLPHQRVFYLGNHAYSAGPGVCWQTEYWVKRLRKGEAWEIFATSPETSGRQRLSMGEYAPHEAREYFESVDFEITSDEWYAMGWRDLDGAEVIDFDES